MKKLAVIILIFVLLFTFAACSFNTGNGNGAGNGNGDNGNGDAITDPIDPSDPVDPSDPTDPTDPSDPTDPVDPSDPTDPTDPTDPSDPTDPKDPVDPEDPVEPDFPYEIEAPVFNDSGYEFSDSVVYNNNNFYKDYTVNEKNLYYLLWQETTTVRIDVDIEPSELAKINEAYTDYKNGNSAKADTYRKCNLKITVNDMVFEYEEVGIRMRGNTSRNYFLNSSGNVNNFVHFRFSLSETFDGDEYKTSWASELYHDWSNDTEGRAARKDRSFATMEKFYYKWNKNYDQTYIREVYANRMFQAYGILAPHITLAQLQMKQNGSMENFGVGSLYETVDKAFIKRNLGKNRKGGDLYKCSYPADFTSASGYGVETATQRFTYSLKTNDDREAEDYNHNNYLKAFIEMLKTDKNADNFKTKLESMVDMNYFARLEAVNYLLGNPDCIRNNSNNFYIYFVPVSDGDYTKSKAYLIPYDYDRCLGANMDWNPRQSMVNATPYELTASGDNATCKNPLYTKTILNGGRSDYRALFTSKINEVLNGEWFTYENYQKLYNAYKANYSSVAMPSQTIRNQCGSNVKMSRFVFNETESSDISTSSSNLTVRLYMEKKRATAINNLDK